MGYIAHDAVIGVLHQEFAEVEAFSLALDAWMAEFVLGPVVGVNGYTTYVFAPDGSKEGWGHSDDAARCRQEFYDLIVKLGGDAIHVRFGGDFGGEIGTTVMSTTDTKFKGLWSDATPELSQGGKSMDPWNMDPR